jgi:Uncharacterized protein conserved in bacteria
MTMQEILEALAAPIPPHLIRQRKRGGAELNYLEWFAVHRLLDERAPGWCGEVRAVTTAGDTVIVCYRISVPAEQGWLHREAVGSDTLGSGFDPVASAEQQAFKRAAARFGLGLELYDKDRPAAAPSRKRGEISRSEWLRIKQRSQPEQVNGLSVD